MIPNDGKNVANNLDKRNKVTGTQRNIINKVRGLGSYTFECSILYLKSMIRGTTLNSSETYYNLIESEVRILESYEEELLFKVLKTGIKCPRSIIYLDLGLWPARFQIKKYKLNYLHVILNQETNSTLYQFFKAQLESPVKGDWVSEIKQLLIDLEINKTFEEIKHMKRGQYEKLVHKKIEQFAFNYLLKKVKSKGNQINYGNKLNIQSYLMPNNVLTLEQQRDIFNYRSEMNPLKNNFKGDKIIQYCVCLQVMENKHLYYCEILNNGRKINHIYEDILNGTLHQQKDIINILTENMKKFETLTQTY